MGIVGKDPELSILDVGVSAQDHFTSNFFEQYYPYRNKLTALGLGDFQELEDLYPGIKYVKGNGHTLPFASGTFDWVFSNAVIEHVGSFNKQVDFLSEVLRVSKHGVFIVCPNRLYPLEFHTGLPLLQYLPKKIHLRIYGILGKSFYSSIENLNILFPWEFKNIVTVALSKEKQSFKFKVSRNFEFLVGLPSNIVYTIQKESIGE